MKLYEYPEKLEKLVRLATEEGDLDDEMLGELKLIKELDSSVESIRGEITRLRNKRESFKKKLEWLKSYVHDQMVGMEMDLVKDDLFTVRISETPGRVDIVDQTVIPARYLEQGEVKVLKSAILTSLKEGELIPGCELVKSTSLRIR